MGMMEWLGRSANRAVDENGREMERVHSWREVFFGFIYPHRFATHENLAEFVRTHNYCCVGQSHSYNGINVADKLDAALLAKSTLDRCNYDDATQTITCGPSTTIKQVKEELANQTQNGRKLANSGNHMAQTMIGALVTGTHGYGGKPTMADSIVSLTFLNGEGEEVTLTPDHEDFRYVALSFGVIAPIVSVTLATVETKEFQSDAWITRLSEKQRLQRGSLATSWAVLPYSDATNPLIMLHTLRDAPTITGKREGAIRPSIFTLKGLTTFFIERLWALDRTFPPLRRRLHRLADWLNIRSHQRKFTKKEDLDYLYDPEPLLKSQRSPNILTGFFSTTYNAYNLAFHVPIEDAEKVVKFIMIEVEKYRSLGFYLKSLIGVRDLMDKSVLPFAGNFERKTAAIDLFADPRDYAWLERVQREVLSYFDDVRPHWGKSAIVGEFAASLGTQHMAQLSRLHAKHYPRKNLKPNEQVRKLFNLGPPAEGAAISLATSDTPPKK